MSRTHFGSNWGKFPDVLLVNSGHWDLFIRILASPIPGGRGGIAYAINVYNSESQWMAIRDSGVDMDKLRDGLQNRGYHGVNIISDFAIGVVPSRSQLKESVMAEVTTLNRQTFQEARTDIATYGRVITHRQKDNPAQAASSPTPNALD